MNVEGMKTYRLMILVITILVIVIGVFTISIGGCTQKRIESNSAEADKGYIWSVPDIYKLGEGPEQDLVRYGRELVAHTAYYLGPKGKVAAITNGMNCQNCHLNAGTKFF